jgi:hypothetical protein
VRCLPLLVERKMLGYLTSAVGCPVRKVADARGRRQLLSMLCGITGERVNSRDVLVTRSLQNCIQAVASIAIMLF